MLSKLTQDEVDTLRAWPEFQERVKAFQDEREAEKERLAREHDESVSRLFPLHYGTGWATQGGIKVWCTYGFGHVYECKNRKEFESLARRFQTWHWHHEDGGNPARKDGDWNAPPDADPLSLRYADLRAEEESATVEA